MAIDDLISAAINALSTVASGIRGKEDLIPLILCESRTGPGWLSAIAYPFPNKYEARKRCFEKMFAREVDKGAIELAFGYMAWQAKRSEKDIEALKRGEGIAPASSRADRTEVIIIMCATAAGEFAVLTASIQRMPDGTVAVGEFIRDVGPSSGLIPDSMRAAFAPRPKRRWWNVFGR
jgi:hypothetical protein